MTAVETPLAEPDQVPVNVAVNRVAAELGAIGKMTAEQRGRAPERRGNSSGDNTPKYAYRSIEDVVNALHPILVRHGVLILPRALDAKFVHLTRTNQYGDQKVSTAVQQHVGWTIVGPMGDTLECATFGEGYDVSDKATNKSTSSALKYLLTTVFSIPTDDYDDPDHSAREVEAGTVEPSPENDRWYDRREDLREQIAGLPDEERAKVVAFLNDQGTNLRRACSAAQLTRVEEFVVRLAIPDEVGH